MAEQRLIDANALDFNFDCNCFNEFDAGYVRGCETIIMTVKNAPTVDAKPVVHAHWNIVVDKGDPESFPEDLEYPQCSNPKCGKISMVKSEFCPHCGAQMDDFVSQ